MIMHCREKTILPQQLALPTFSNKHSKRPSAEHTSPGYQRGATCVQQFHDSLNSAIRNTMSHFATVFIDVQAKGSTVGSCFVFFGHKLPCSSSITYSHRQTRPKKQRKGLCTANPQNVPPCTTTGSTQAFRHRRQKVERKQPERKQ